MASPLIEQYLELKSQHEDKVLFFRLGDFYEMFYQDAIEISSVLNLVLTKRKNKIDGEIPMCGIPFHSREGYLEKLIQQGYQVAIAEQVEKAKPGKDLVKREITKIITQGTILLESSKETGEKNSHIAAITRQKSESYITILNPISGKITLTTAKKGQENNVLNRFNVLEVVGRITMSKTNRKVVEPPSYVNKKTDEHLKKLAEKLGVFSLDVYNVPRGTLFEKPLASLIWYLDSIHAGEKILLSEIVFDMPESYVYIDDQTKKNLEVFPYEQGKVSLWDIIHKTQTPMGSRLLHQWMSSPRKDLKTLKGRVESIDWVKNHKVWNTYVSMLSGVKDIERLTAKASYGTIAPTEMISLSSSITNAKHILSYTSEKYSSIEELSYLNDFNADDTSIENYIEERISAEATNNGKAGSIINNGISKELDELKEIATSGKQWLAEYQTKLKQDLNIPTLKIGFNKVFGYYVEVSKTHAAKIPNSYSKKQTLVNAERFITEELKSYESKILTAEEKIIEIEQRIFEEVCGKVVENSEVILNIAKRIAWIDVISSQAKVSYDYNYQKPCYHEGWDLKIQDGRHPVVERLLQDNEFMSNSTVFNNDNQSYILTGPNMGGKSTYIRQIALIVYMAQVGLHVPAKEVKISPVDRIFSRVGASDNLSEGKSTFMVEMTEVANILMNATDKSLVILDEVGRGTSTTDGRALAKSVVEYLHTKIKAKMIFATHFHELADLQSKYVGMKNIHVSVEENENDLIFYHQIKSGSASKSYGIEIARLAGVPHQVIKNAFNSLEELPHQPQQSSIFEIAPEAASDKTNKKPNDIIEKLEEIDIDNLTPLQALQTLNNLKEILHEKNS